MCLTLCASSTLRTKLGTESVLSGYLLIEASNRLQGFYLTPWTARRSNQSILNETNPEYLLEGLLLKLKLQYFGHLMQRTYSLGKTQVLGKIEGRRRKGQQRMRWHQKLNRHEFEQAPGDSAGQGSLRAAVHGVTKSRTGLRD